MTLRIFELTVPQQLLDPSPPLLNGNSQGQQPALSTVPQQVRQLLSFLFASP
jgi:hypothetical protein